MTKQLPNSNPRNKAVMSKTTSKAQKHNENQEVQLIPLSFVSDTNNTRFLSAPNLDILRGFAASELFNEDDGLHEEVRYFFAAYCRISSLNPSSIIEPETWKCIFLSSLVNGALTSQFSFTSEETVRLQTLLVRLCRSDPLSTFKSFVRKSGTSRGLLVNNMTSCWRGALLTLGTKYSAFSSSDSASSIRGSNEASKDPIDKKGASLPMDLEAGNERIPDMAGQNAGSMDSENQVQAAFLLKSSLSPDSEEKEMPAELLNSSQLSRTSLLSDTTSISTKKGSDVLDSQPIVPSKSPLKSALRNSTASLLHKTTTFAQQLPPLQILKKPPPTLAQQPLPLQTVNNSPPDMKRKFSIRVDGFFKVKETKTMVVSTITAVREWYEELVAVDPCTIIYPWSNSSRDAPLSKTSAFPSSLLKLSVYFNKIAAPKRANDFVAYAQVRLGTDTPPDSFLVSNPDSSLHSYYSDAGISIYQKPLSQSDRPEYVGYFTYTGNFTHRQCFEDLIRGLLAQEDITKEIGVKVKAHPKLSNMRDLRQAHYDRGGNWYNQNWVTAQLYCDRNDVRAIKDAMIKIFNRDHLTYLPFKFIPSETNTFSTLEGREKRSGMWEKHRKVVADLVYILNNDVTSLDSPSHDGKTLRHYLYELKSIRTGRQLIHSVDFATRQSDPDRMTTVIMVFPEHVDEAEATMSLLPKSLFEEVGEQVNQWFSSEAVRESMNIFYDSLTNKYVTEDDKMLGILLTEKVGDKTIIFDMEVESSPSKEAARGLRPDDLSHATSWSQSSRSDSTTMDVEDGSRALATNAATSPKGSPIEHSFITTTTITPVSTITPPVHDQPPRDEERDSYKTQVSLLMEQNRLLLEELSLFKRQVSSIFPLPPPAPDPNSGTTDSRPMIINPSPAPGLSPPIIAASDADASCSVSGSSHDI